MLPFGSWGLGGMFALPLHLLCMLHFGLWPTRPLGMLFALPFLPPPHAALKDVALAPPMVALCPSLHTGSWAAGLARLGPTSQIV